MTKRYWKPGLQNYEFRNKPDSGFFFISDELAVEDPRWLQVENILNEFNVEIPTVTVNQALKDQIIAQDAQDQFDKDAADQRQASVDLLKNRYRFSEEIRAEIALLNISKSWTKLQLRAYLRDPIVNEINLQLISGTLETVADYLLTANLTKYYSNEEVTSIRGKILNYIANE